MNLCSPYDTGFSPVHTTETVPACFMLCAVLENEVHGTAVRNMDEIVQIDGDLIDKSPMKEGFGNKSVLSSLLALKEVFRRQNLGRNRQLAITLDIRLPITYIPDDEESLKFRCGITSPPKLPLLLELNEKTNEDEGPESELKLEVDNIRKKEVRFKVQQKNLPKSANLTKISKGWEDLKNCERLKLEWKSFLKEKRRNPFSTEKIKSLPVNSVGRKKTRCRKNLAILKNIY